MRAPSLAIALLVLGSAPAASTALAQSPGPEAGLGSLYYWRHGKAVGSRAYWERGDGPGSYRYWKHATGPGSEYFWLYGHKPGSRYHWRYSTRPGSEYFWKYGKGPGSAYFWKYGKEPGSEQAWLRGREAGPDPVLTALCAAGALEIELCAPVRASVLSTPDPACAGAVAREPLDTVRDPSRQRDREEDVTLGRPTPSGCP